MQALLRTLKEAGVSAKAYQISYAISVGHLPRPEVVSGRFVFDDKFVSRCRRYLAEQRKGGRRKATDDSPRSRD
jgi:hypothetical protein